MRRASTSPGNASPGAALLKKPKKLERLVRGIAVAFPSVDGEDSIGSWIVRDARVRARRGCPNAGAAAVVIHGRTKDQRYTRAANWDLIGEIQRERSIPVIGASDILTWYEHRERSRRAGCPPAMRVAARSSSRGFSIRWRRGRGDATAVERVAVYPPTVRALKDHLRADAALKKPYMEFMPWLDFYLAYRGGYRPLPRERVRRDGSLPSARADPPAGQGGPRRGRRTPPSISRLCDHTIGRLKRPSSRGWRGAHGTTSSC